MPWGRLDDGLYDHPKLDLLGRDRLPAVGLWTLAISWSNRRLTDGFIPTERIRQLGATRSLAERLVEVGLFDRLEEGYAIHDFLEFNDSAAAVQARRDAAAERQRRHRSGDRESRSESHEQSRRDTPRDATRDMGRESRDSPRAPAAARPGPARPNPGPEIPPPPAERGRRKDETNPRANGTAPRQAGENPRANGTSPRQHREAEKRAPTALGRVLTETVRRQAGADEAPDWLREPAEAKS